jgi:uncharacterized membrane protein
MQSTMIVAAALAAALALTGCATNSKQTAQAQPQAEKCFGVAKAGQNDCKAGSHACKGQSTADADPQSFMLLPAGTCSKLVGGSTA